MKFSLITYFKENTYDIILNIYVNSFYYSILKANTFFHVIYQVRCNPIINILITFISFVHFTLFNEQRNKNIYHMHSFDYKIQTEFVRASFFGGVALRFFSNFSLLSPLKNYFWRLRCERAMVFIPRQYFTCAAVIFCNLHFLRKWCHSYLFLYYSALICNCSCAPIFHLSQFITCKPCTNHWAKTSAPDLLNWDLIRLVVSPRVNI